jgi:hypothetical protein
MSNTPYDIRPPHHVMCRSAHDCDCGQGRCTRLAHTGLHRCIWCGTEWDDTQAAS